MKRVVINIEDFLIFYDSDMINLAGDEVWL